ncbi:MAG: preprotein translocase subunit SecE [Hyphomonadaceae bacterium]|nr:preprotein translocase subunit SecE [Hyphomonadaceae bacterium]
MDTADQESEPRRKTGLFTFFKEVRAEGRKVTWATRSEVTVSTIMVLMFAVVAAIFFFIVDTVMRLGVGLILGIGGGN